MTNNGTIINNGTIDGTINGTQPEAGSVVTNSDELTAALAGEAAVITVKGTIGSESEYGTYTVARPVTIKGENGSKVYGSFIVKADGVVFDGVTIHNKGGSDEHKNAINAYTKKITIKDCTFESGSAFANGVVIFPSAADVNFNITGNTFNGYDNGTSDWATTGLMITGGYTMSSKPFFGVTGNAFDAAGIDDEAIITGNTFANCSVDYTRDNWSENNTKNKVFVRAISAGENFYFEGAADTANYYVNGDVTISESKTVKAGTTLKVMEGKSLTVGNGAVLTVNGTVSGNIIVADGGDVKINANASKLPENCEITVEAGGVLSAISTADNSTPIEIIGNDSSSRIELTEGNAVFTFGEAGTKPQLSLNGTANVPASVTAYNHFGSEGDIIGIDMTVNGDFTVDGTFKVSSANSTGSTLTIADGSALTVNGTLSVAAKGTVVNNGTMTDNGSFVNNGTFTNNGSFESSGVLGTILEATGYTYEDREYIGTFNPVILSGTAVRFDGTYSAEQAAKEEGDAIMNDMARFLGALYRIDDGASVTKLTYKGTEYTWNAEGILAGSNWEDESGKTLVSAIIDDYKETSQLSPIEITVNDEVEMTLNASVGQ